MIEKDGIAKAIFDEKESDIYSIKSYINKLCNTHLFSHEEYKKRVKKYVGLKNKIPIILNDKHLFFYFKSNDGKAYLINYFALAGITKEELIGFHFANGIFIYIDGSIAVLKKELKKIERLILYLKELKLI